MRTIAPTVRTVRATSRILTPSFSPAQRRIARPVFAAGRCLEIARCEQRRGLAKVNGNEKELGLAQDAWFNGTGPSAFPVEGPGSGLDHRPPDERTLKLGKSEFHVRSVISLDLR